VGRNAAAYPDHFARAAIGVIVGVGSGVAVAAGVAVSAGVTVGVAVSVGSGVAVGVAVRMWGVGKTGVDNGVQPARTSISSKGTKAIRRIAAIVPGSGRGANGTIAYSK
jgi:hypothetical protein